MIYPIDHLMGEFAQALCQNQKVILQFDLNCDQLRKVGHFDPYLGLHRTENLFGLEPDLHQKVSFSDMVFDRLPKVGHFGPYLGLYQTESLFGLEPDLH
jgi:hypothetical protein